MEVEKYEWKSDCDSSSLSSLLSLHTFYFLFLSSRVSFPTGAKVLIKTLSFSTTYRERIRRIESVLPKQGYPSFFLTGQMNSLMVAMAFSSLEIVSLLLETGVQVHKTDINGLDPLMFASITGNLQNVDMWLNCFRKWDLSRRDKVVGGTVLLLAARIGSNQYGVIKRLLDAGANIDTRTRIGSSCLSMAVSNEDASQDVVRLIVNTSKVRLQRQDSIRARHENLMNGKREVRVMNWKVWDLVSWFLSSWSIIHNQKSIAEDVGETVLHCAVKTGDTDMVSLLLRLGCDSDIRDSNGLTPMESAKKIGVLSTSMEAVFKSVRERKG